MTLKMTRYHLLSQWHLRKAKRQTENPEIFHHLPVSFNSAFSRHSNEQNGYVYRRIRLHTEANLRFYPDDSTCNSVYFCYRKTGVGTL